MKKSISAIILASVAFLTTCNSGVDPAVSEISGSITVAQESDWAKLKIGVFYCGTDSGTYIYYVRSREETVTGDGITRLIFEKGGIDLGKQDFSPNSGGAGFSITSGVHGTFHAELPGISIGAHGGAYRVVAWLDEDSDSKLDLIDGTLVPAWIAGSEFNRCPSYDGGGFYAGGFFLENSGYVVSGRLNEEWKHADLVDTISSAFSFDMTPVAVDGSWFGW